MAGDIPVSAVAEPWRCDVCGHVSENGPAAIGHAMTEHPNTPGGAAQIPGGDR